MNNRHLIAGFLIGLCCTEALAVQLGQLSSYSRLGEPLIARIDLYGAQTDELALSSFELRPEIGTRSDSAEQRALSTISPSLARDRRGQPYLKLTSTVPVNEPIVSFRVRLQTGATTSVRHYTLALDPAVYRSKPVPPIAEERGVAPMTNASGSQYGPVRSGQSLWRIMRETGLATSDTGATIERIIADNPHAFVAGDANRLRVGVMLVLPQRDSAATTRPATMSVDAIAEEIAPASATAIRSPAALSMPSAQSADRGAGIAATSRATAPDISRAARLAALEVKFAAIRKRYASQQPTASPSTESAVAAVVLAMPAAAATDDDIAVVKPQETSAETSAAMAPRTTEPATADLGGPFLDDGSFGKLALTVLGLVLLGSLTAKASLAGMAYLRRRGLQQAELTADEDLKAEIGLKAEKRLQLEDEVKRRIAEKREPEPAESGDAKARAGEVVSIEEIESRIAHGYYSEAERLLLDVIARTPGNHRAKLLLVEVYYLNERVEDFVRITEEIQLLHRSDIGDDHWQRIMRMGKVLAPERALFSGPTAIDREA
ncbi:MAG: hypothetical protein O7G83_09610 [Proteobacteria bacterium]|nr:hypothetical protein [Pseudomonadota bacterium]